MRDLNYQLKQLCKRNRDGSYSTQANRARMLNQIANQLQEMGYRRMTTDPLKPKHVDALVKRWLGEGMAAGTIKNRMNCLRWWAAKVDRRNVIARSNEFYGIPDRQFVSNESKAVVVDSPALSSIQDDFVRMSQGAATRLRFAKRRQSNSCPVSPIRAIISGSKATWTKGGKTRRADPPSGPASRPGSCAPIGREWIPDSFPEKLYPAVEPTSAIPQAGCRSCMACAMPTPSHALKQLTGWGLSCRGWANRRQSQRRPTQSRISRHDSLLAANSAMPESRSAQCI